MKDLLEGRREGDLAGVARRSDHGGGDLAPAAADAGAGDDVLPQGPAVLARLHASDDLAEKLRQHPRPSVI